MTQTSHGHHIAGTPADDEKAMLIVDCGGPPACDSCVFDIRWHKNYAEAKRNRQASHIFPSELIGLDSQIIRKISAKLRERAPKPSLLMRAQDYQKATLIHSLADAIDIVAHDLES